MIVASLTAQMHWSLVFLPSCNLVGAALAAPHPFKVQEDAHYPCAQAQLTRNNEASLGQQ
jgi:hypothetical protein